MVVLVEHLHEDRESHADFEQAYSQTAKRESNTDFSSQSLAAAESHSGKTSLRSLPFYAREAYLHLSALVISVRSN